MPSERAAVSRSVALAVLGAALVPVRARTQPLATVVISQTNSDAETPILYGVTSGLFRRNGLEVVPQPAPSGAAALAALAGGSLQFAGANVLSIAAGHLKGVPLEIVAPGGAYNGTTEFVAAIVRKDAPFQTARDLNGRVAGVASVGDLNAISLVSWIDQNGGDAKSVRQVEIPYATTVAALEAGRIDVSVVVQPFLSQALDSGKTRIFAPAYSAIAQRFVFAAWVSAGSWAAANPEVARRFARAVREAEIFCNGHRSETAPLLAKLAGVDVQQVLRGGRNTFAGRFADPKDFQPLIDAGVHYGTLERRFDAVELISPAIRGLSG
jgi:NitT/TauT family transport system substrate-binding protein